jgi:hypothetical protein
VENCVKLSSIVTKNAIIFRVLYFNANKISVYMKPAELEWRCREPCFSVFLCFFFFGFWMLLSVASLNAPLSLSQYLALLQSF